MHITTETHLPDVIEVALNRPEKRNALNISLLIELNDALRTLPPATRVLILKGEGTVFCAGMDLNEAQDPQLTSLLRELLAALYRAPFVTIAAVHGAALAGGAGLLAACDLVLATPETKIGFPEVRRGLVAALVATLLLRQIAPRHVRELLLLGELIEVERAHAIGFVNKIAAFADLLPMARYLAEEILKCGPEAIKSTKKLLTSMIDSSLDRDLEAAAAISEVARNSQEAAEGIQAFLEKRVPKFNSYP